MPFCPPARLQVQEALDRLLAFGPVDRAVQAAKPRFEVVSAVGQSRAVSAPSCLSLLGSIECSLLCRIGVGQHCHDLQ